jgi:hypothetical protein
VAERHRLQPRQSVAAAGAAQGDQDLLADQFAATAGQDRWPAAQARPLLLIAASGEPPYAPILRHHVKEDRNAAVAGGIAESSVTTWLQKREIRSAEWSKGGVWLGLAIGIRSRS